MATKSYICPVCNSDSNVDYRAMNNYLLLKCISCGFVWDNNISENILKIYDKSYYKNENPKGGYANYFEGMKINKKTFIDRLNKIHKKLLRKGKLLDVGAALGDFLEVAQSMGWKNSYGVEVSKFAVDTAKSRGIKNIKNSTLANSNYKFNNFDAITYQDVIEHIDKPVAELKTAYKYLKKGGIIYIVTPDIGGFWKLILGPMWYHFKPKEHISYFNEKSLKIALEQSGFVDIETKKTYHVLSIEYILNRLKYYSPLFFGTLLKISNVILINKLAFKAYTGEIEAWARKI